MAPTAKADANNQVITYVLKLLDIKVEEADAPKASTSSKRAARNARCKPWRSISCGATRGKKTCTCYSRSTLHASTLMCILTLA
jgi:hypothetical protein